MDVRSKSNPLGVGPRFGPPVLPVRDNPRLLGGIGAFGMMGDLEDLDGSRIASSFMGNAIDAIKIGDIPTAQVQADNLARMYERDSIRWSFELTQDIRAAHGSLAAAIRAWSGAPKRMESGWFSVVSGESDVPVPYTDAEKTAALGAAEGHLFALRSIYQTLLDGQYDEGDRISAAQASHVDTGAIEAAAQAAKEEEQRIRDEHCAVQRVLTGEISQSAYLADCVKPQLVKYATYAVLAFLGYKIIVGAGIKRLAG